MKRFALLFTLVFTLIFVGCQKDEEAVVTGIEFSESGIKLKIGEMYEPKVLHTPVDLPAPDYTWESLNGDVAAISDDGSIKAKAAGNTTIIVSDSDGRLSAEVDVTVKPVVANGIVLTPSSASVLLGDTLHLDYVIEPDTTTNKEVVWSSDHPEIGEVNDGILRTLQTGTAVVRVTVAGTDLEAACTIEILPVPVTSITLSEERLELFPGDEAALSYTIEPDTATNPAMVWSSDDQDVAIVENGKVTAVAPGTANITLREEGSEVSAVCAVEVSTVGVTGISLSQEELILEVDRNVQLSATIQPEDATNRNISWQVSDPAIVTVDEAGKVRGISEGLATITAMAEDGGYSASCEVEVIAIRARGVELSVTEKEMLVGDTFQLEADVTPSDAANKDVTWSSRDETIVTVSPDGTVTAMNEGTTYVEVTTEDGAYSALCRAEVVPMTAMMDLFFLDYFFSSVNGYCTGEFRFGIHNTSLYDVLLTELYIYAGDTEELISYTTDPAKLGILEGDTNAGISLSIDVNYVYKPIVKWVFEYEGKLILFSTNMNSELFNP